VHCTNLPCALSGATTRGRAPEEKAPHRLERNDGDGRVYPEGGECSVACGDAPVMLLNNKKMLSFMTPDKIDKWIAEAK